jgi:hypothetical protein
MSSVMGMTDRARTAQSSPRHHHQLISLWHAKETWNESQSLKLGINEVNGMNF